MGVGEEGPWQRCAQAAARRRPFWRQAGRAPRRWRRRQCQCRLQRRAALRQCARRWHTRCRGGSRGPGGRAAATASMSRGLTWGRENAAARPQMCMDGPMCAPATSSAVQSLAIALPLWSPRSPCSRYALTACSGLERGGERVNAGAGAGGCFGRLWEASCSACCEGTSYRSSGTRREQSRAAGDRLAAFRSVTCNQPPHHGSPASGAAAASLPVPGRGRGCVGEGPRPAAGAIDRGIWVGGHAIAPSAAPNVPPPPPLAAV